MPVLYLHGFLVNHQVAALWALVVECSRFVIGLHSVNNEYPLHPESACVLLMIPCRAGAVMFTKAHG
eukprot:scaffold556518_cov15-Prasinocladus_malaysianus.AAC.1